MKQDHSITWCLFAMIIAIIIDFYSADECNDSYSCALDKNITNITACKGYFSCAWRDLISITSNLSCDGSFSCYETSLMHLNNTENILTTYLYCNGLYSCANIGKLFFKNYSSYASMAIAIECNGELSCYNTTFVPISPENTGAQIQCNGDRSCANSNISVYCMDVDIYGYLSAQNTVFYVDSCSSISFQGFLSGQNATIVCVDDGNDYSYVYVSCYMNSCDDLHTINGTFCEVYLVYDGMFDWPSNASASTEYIFPPLYPNVTKTKTTDFQNSAETCKTPRNMTSIICESNSTSYTYNYNYNDGYSYNSDCSDTNNIIINTGLNNTYPINCENCQECNANVLNSHDFIDPNVHHISVPICCTASASCMDAPNITTYMPINNNNNECTIMRCDGYTSCANSEIRLLSSVKNINNDVYLSGNGAATDTVIYGLPTMNTNIFCGGLSACTGNTVIYSTSNIICSGAGSCAGRQMYNIIHSVYLYGLGSYRGENALNKIENVGENIICFDYNYYSKFVAVEVGGNVFLQSSDSLEDIVINTVGNNVFLASCYLDTVVVSNVKNTLFVAGDSKNGLIMQSVIFKNITNVCITLFYIYQWQYKGTLVMKHATYNVQIIINATQSCYGYDVNISNTKNIQVFGKYCLSDTTVISNFSNYTKFEEDRTLNLKIDGMQDEFTIICNVNDTCIVECMSKGSCATIDFYCDGNCWVYDATGMPTYPIHVHVDI